MVRILPMSTAAKSDSVRFTTKGQVVAAESRQQTDYTSGEPLTWDDGNPRMQLVITLATDERDPDDPTDDGHRNLYAKGKLLDAIRQALKAAGVKLAEGERRLERWLAQQANDYERRETCACLVTIAPKCDPTNDTMK